MSIGKLSGLMLQKNLIREGTDLRFDSNLLYLDVAQRRIGVHTDNASEITDSIHVINGNVRADYFIGNISPDITSNSVVHILGTGALAIPYGNTAQQPDPTEVTEGAIRYNTDSGDLQYFDGSLWRTFTIEPSFWTFTISNADEVAYRDTYPLDPNITGISANSIIVSLNGVIQAPEESYTVTANNEIQFTANGPENLRSGDIVGVRYISTATHIPGIINTETVNSTTINANVLNGLGSITNISNVAPSSSSDTGEKGEIAWDSSYLYICVEANTWIRSNIETSF
jgi:hypothetical protein